MPQPITVPTPAPRRYRPWLTPLVVAGLIGLAFLAWIPASLELALPSDDQVWEAQSVLGSCRPGAFLLGWLGEGGAADGGGDLFTPSLSAALLQTLSCRLALATGLAPLQASLVLGLSLTYGLSALACRLGGFRGTSSALAAFLITTAPCAFSRLPHPSLATLWAVIPGLMACRGLWRAMTGSAGWWRLMGGGLLASLLCLPTQEYYVFFTLLLLSCSYGVLLLLAATRTVELRPLARVGLRGLAFAGPFLAVVVLLQVPRLLAVSGAGGPPTAWSSGRLAIEQFRYGLLPLSWLIPSPWVPSMRELLESGGIDTSRETFFWSTGSALIPIAWGMAFWNLASARPGPTASAPDPQSIAAVDAVASPHSDRRERNRWRRPAGGLEPIDVRFYALLLLLTTVVGLLWMTMGGLGTLVAVAVSPVLRALNRFTAFEYGASVLMVVAVIDRLSSSPGLGSARR